MDIAGYHLQKNRGIGTLWRRECRDVLVYPASSLVHTIGRGVCKLWSEDTRVLRFMIHATYSHMHVDIHTCTC